jgi:hypothetical protein
MDLHIPNMKLGLAWLGQFLINHESLGSGWFSRFLFCLCIWRFLDESTQKR